MNLSIISALLVETFLLASFFILIGLLYLIYNIITAYIISWIYVFGTGLILFWLVTSEWTPSPAEIKKRKETFVVIVGAGFSGICAAIRLKKERIRFVLIEKSDNLGGTWLDNKYPGCGSDIISFLFCFSFKPNYFSSSSYVKQSEIRAYLEDTVDHYGVREHMWFGSKVEKCEFDDVHKTWSVKTSTGDEIKCNYIISGIGALHKPNFPEIQGTDDFKGDQIHTAQWNTSFDWTDKRVGIIGTGAAAIHAVPKLGSSPGGCKELHVFQRTPPWIISMLNPGHSKFFQKCLQHVPMLMKLCRFYIFFRQELIYKMLFSKDSLGNLIYRRAFALIMRKQIDDPSMRDDFIPNYQIFCRRIGISNSYLSTFNSTDGNGNKKVHLVTDEIVKMTENSIVVKKSIKDSSSKEPTLTTTNEESRKIELDAIIYATGFDVLNSLKNIDIRRPSDGQSIGDVWEDTPNAYLGIMAPQFPNFFILLGPNTALGMVHTFFINNLRSNHGNHNGLLKD